MAAGAMTNEALRITLAALVIAGTVTLTGCAAPASRSSKPVVIVQEGTFRSPSGRCVATVTHEDGDRLALHVPGCKAPLSEDLSGMAWISRDRLVFISSSIYGTPGLFLYVCGEDSARTIVGSHSKDSGHYEDVDYFELIRVGVGDNPELVFRYFPDVDSLGPAGTTEGGTVVRVRADGRGLKGLR